MNLSKLNLPEDVRPRWTERRVPWCSGVAGGCSSLRGRNCEHRPGRSTGAGDVCDPAVEAMAQAIPGFLEGA